MKAGCCRRNDASAAARCWPAQESNGRELLNRTSSDLPAPSSRWAQVLQLLLASTEAEEEVRGVLAECLGHLALLDPGETLPSLQAAAAGDSPAARAAVRTAAFHFCFSVDDSKQHAVYAHQARANNPCGRYKFTGRDGSQARGRGGAARRRRAAAGRAAGVPALHRGPRQVPLLPFPAVRCCRPTLTTHLGERAE